MCARVLTLLLIAALPGADAGVGLHPVSIKAPRAAINSKTHQVVYSGGVRVVRDTMTLTCDQLEAEWSGDDVTTLLATGHVVGIDGDREAHSDRAEYDNRTGVLVATGHPWGRQGTREVEGETLTFTTGIDRMLVTHARTRTVEQKTGAVTIDADTLTLEQPKSTAVWRGHVRAVRGPTVMTAPELEATWDDSGSITRMIARGGVEAVEPKRRARGQRADYDVTKGTLVVTGNPEAHTDTSHMRGTRVTFFPDSDFVEVENATTILDVKRKHR